MKKTLLAVLSITLLLPVTVAKAAPAPTPTIAVLDTAINSSLPIFKDKISAEVCLINWTTCPNGKSYMEGPGAAGLPTWMYLTNGWDHGNEMASIVLKNNPNVNIVFIKIIGNTATGARQLAPESAVYNALNWVYANKDKYNIQAVTMSQGHHNLLTTTDYCPKTPTTEASVKALLSVGIPTFFPTGNGRDYKRIDWPSCIDASISVGAVDQIGDITSYTNYDTAKVDFLALGNMTATRPDGIEINVAGTSAAVQVAAAQWLMAKQAKQITSVDGVYTLLASTASKATGRQGSFVKLINLIGALNAK
jgi:hypothetical protein